VLERHHPIAEPGIPAILETTAWARKTARELYLFSSREKTL